MKLRVLFSALALMLPATMLFAQHSDIEFGYDSTSSPTAFVIENDNLTDDGFQFWEAEFEALDPNNTSDLSSDEPGFTTNDLEGLLINENDQVFLTAVDASTLSSVGVGFVNFYNPNTDALEAAGRLAIIDNTAGTDDLVLNGASIESGPAAQFLGLGDSDGDLHDHVVIDLLDDSTAAVGAYGVMFQLQSDFAAADGNMDLTSDAFWIVWNNGMDEEDFEASLSAFGFNPVPEPGSAIVLSALAGVCLMRRRRS